MPDMLVKLYELPEANESLARLRGAGIDIRRALPPEKHVVLDWVQRTFGQGWASECDVSFGNKPVSCYIAVEQKTIIGFACYDATCKDFFGPTGVSEKMRGEGVGKALLLVCLHALREQGYAYAIIGGAGPADFYRKTVGATEIDGSVPGIYRGML